MILSMFVAVFSFCFCSRYGTSLQPIMITKVMNKNYYNKTVTFKIFHELACRMRQNVNDDA